MVATLICDSIARQLIRTCPGAHGIWPVRAPSAVDGGLGSSRAQRQQTFHRPTSRQLHSGSSRAQQNPNARPTSQQINKNEKCSCGMHDIPHPSLASFNNNTTFFIWVPNCLSRKFRMESEDEDCGSSYETASESDESIARPTFIPKNQRITLTEGQRKKNEDSLRDEKKRLEEELRKSKTRAFVAENVRRIAENVDVQNKDGYDSEFGMPDCEEEKLDDDIEVRTVVVVLSFPDEVIILSVRSLEVKRNKAFEA